MVLLKASKYVYGNFPYFFFPVALLLRSFIFTGVSEILISMIFNLSSSYKFPVGMTNPALGAISR